MTKGCDVPKCEVRLLKVIAEDFIKPEHIEAVMPLYKELISATKREPLCIAYDLYIDEKDPGHFIFIEEWPDRAALATRLQPPRPEGDRGSIRSSRNPVAASGARVSCHSCRPTSSTSAVVRTVLP